MRKEIIGNCELYLGDCLEVMEGLDKVDHAIFDPPYEERTQKVIGTLRRNDWRKSEEKINFQAIDNIRDQTAELISKVCNGWAILFCTAEGVAPWRGSIEKYDIKYKRACVWIKPDSMPQMNGQGPANGLEMIVTAWNNSSHSKWNSGGKRGVYTHQTNQPDRTGLHPTEKPIPLMREILCDFTNPGQTILDPFMGSGTTGVACVKLGRKFIGIELDEKYFDIACKRIEEAYKQPDFLIEPPIKHIQDKFI